MHHEVDELVYDEDLEPEERAMVESDLDADAEEDEEPDDESMALVEADGVETGDGNEAEPAPAGTETETAEDIEEAEASLDEILRERVEGGEAEAYEEEAEEEERAAVLTAPAEVEARPRGANEFLCLSCFLIKHRRQLADAEGSLCRDCADTA